MAEEQSDARSNGGAAEIELRGTVSLGGDVIQRYDRNPIIGMNDLPYSCADIVSAGAVKVGADYVLLITVQTLEGFYSLYTARSRDGYTFDLAPEPLLSPLQDGQWSIYEGMGVLNARITRIDDMFYISYDALGQHGHCLALAKTKDFKTALRLGIVAEPDNKAGTLFPRKIDGMYVRLERPAAGGSIWISSSKDLEYWGAREIVMSPRTGYWDTSRISPSTPPIEIEQGWLFFYSGVKDTSAGPLFRIGAAILQTEYPSKLLARTNVPVLTPRMLYERVGNTPNMVYSCGAIVEDDGEVKLYYGAADSSICVGTTTVDAVVEACMESDREY